MGVINIIQGILSDVGHVERLSVCLIGPSYFLDHVEVREVRGILVGIRRVLSRDAQANNQSRDRWSGPCTPGKPTKLAPKKLLIKSASLYTLTRSFNGNFVQCDKYVKKSLYYGFAHANHSY